MPTINGVINKVSPSKSPLVYNGGKTRSVNGLRHVDYDKWRMNWNGNHFAPPIVSCVLYLPGVPGFGSTIFDHSGQGNNGAIVGTATWAQNVNGLYYIAFAGGEVNVTHSASLDITTGNFSVACWFRTSTDADAYAVGKYPDTAYWLLRIRGVANRWEFNIYDGVNSPTVASTTDPVDGKWHLLVATRDDTNLNVYTDGALDCTPAADTAGDISNAATLDLGKVGALDASTCDIALFRLYNTALAATVISGIYNQERHLFGI